MPEQLPPVGDDLGDDALAARLRVAVDARATPIDLDEVRALAARPLDGTTGLGAGDPDPQGDVRQLPPAGDRRRGIGGRAPILVAAAVVVVLAATFAVLRSRDGVVVTTDPAAEEAGFVGAEPGGLYDPASNLLHDKHVLAMTGAEGRLYVTYTDASAADPTTGEGIVGALMVADAAGGEVLDGYVLDDGATATSITSTGPAVWFVTHEPTRDRLWRIVGTGPLEPIDDLPAPMHVVGDEAGLWLRGGGTLQQRDPVSGALLASTDDPAWVGPSTLAVDQGDAWAVDATTGEIVAVDGVERGEAVTAPVADPPSVAAAGGSVFALAWQRATRFDPVDGRGLDEVWLPTAITGVAHGGDDLWLASSGDSPDPFADVDLAVVDGRTGAVARATLDLAGRSPLVAVVDGGAVVCVATGSQPISAAPPDGSACRQVTGPGVTPDPAVPPVDWTFVDRVVAVPGTDPTPTTAGIPAPETTPTTAPASTTTTAPPPSTTVAPRPLDPRGITLDGLAPIRLGMTANELKAATGLETTLAMVCGNVDIEVVGLPDGVFVRFVDGRVYAITIRSGAFSTVDGLSVDSPVTELRSVHPDAEVVDLVTAVQHLVVAPDRSRSIAFTTEGDDITVITVIQSDEAFMDLC